LRRATRSSRAIESTLDLANTTDSDPVTLRPETLHFSETAALASSGTAVAAPAAPDHCSPDVRAAERCASRLLRYSGTMSCRIVRVAYLGSGTVHQALHALLARRREALARDHGIERIVTGALTDLIDVAGCAPGVVP
jgi:hypothetical protein